MIQKELFFHGKRKNKGKGTRKDESACKSESEGK